MDRTVSASSFYDDIGKGNIEGESGDEEMYVVSVNLTKSFYQFQYTLIRSYIADESKKENILI